MFILTITGDPASSDGRIQPGDQLVEVDGRSLMGLPYLEGVAIIKATSNMAIFRVRTRKDNREGDMSNREGDMPNREGNMPNREGDMPSREGDTQSPLGREKEQPHGQMVSVGTPLEREEPRDGSVKSADVGFPLASGENVATTTQQATPSLEESTPTQQEATPTQQKATPTQQEATPTQQKATPTQQEATPSPKDQYMYMPLGTDLFKSSRANHTPELDHAHKLDHAHQLDRPLGRSGHMFAGGVTTTSHEGALPGRDGDGDLTDVTDTEIESDDEISAPPPPLPTSPIPHDTPTHTLVVEDS